MTKPFLVAVGSLQNKQNVEKYFFMVDVDWK